jgi:hypothetical protein
MTQYLMQLIELPSFVSPAAPWNEQPVTAGRMLLIAQQLGKQFIN